MNKELNNLIIEQDQSIKEFINDVCDAVIEYWGEHNYKTVRDIVNERLKEDDNH